MIYSVYNLDTKAYDYYEGSGPRGTHAGAPPVTLGRHELGATVEQAGWKLPANAKKIGAGELPRGRIAAAGFGGLGDILSGGGGLEPLIKVGVVAAAAYWAWRHLR